MAAELTLSDFIEDALPELESNLPNPVYLTVLHTSGNLHMSNQGYTALSDMNNSELEKTLAKPVIF